MEYCHGLHKQNRKSTFTIVVKTQSQSKENYEINVHILKCIVKSVDYCGLQGITFRTRNKGNLDGNENPGNFVAFLKF